MSARAKRAKRSSNLGVLPLTSMIDVVFLLLVYFLVTSSFSEPEKELPSSLKTEGGGVRASDLQPQIVEIERAGNAIVYRLGSRQLSSRADLRAVLEALPKEPGIAIKAARGVPVESIALVLQEAETAGFTRRSYVPRDH